MTETGTIVPLIEDPVRPGAGGAGDADGGRFGLRSFARSQRPLRREAYGRRCPQR